MYILIELVPEACGTGFGVFCCVLLGLVLLFIMAQYAMTWRRPGRRCFCWRPGWVDGRG